MDEVKQSFDEVKALVAKLTETVQTQSSDVEKQQNIIKELQEKQDKLETERQRKGFFSEDGIEREIDVKASSLDTLIRHKSLDEKVNSLQSANDEIMIVSQLLDKDPRETKIFKDYVETNPYLKKALSSEAAGTGDEWVPTGYSAQLYDRIRLALKVATLHNSIDMPRNPYQLPLLLSDATGYLVAERTGDDDTLTAAYRMPASNVGTGNVTLTAKKLAGRVVFSEELSEDSIVPILPIVRDNIVIAISTAIEKAIIDGDTSGTHQDADVTAATDARKAWTGYRKSVQAAAKTSLATFNGDNILTMRKTMGKYGIDPTKLCFVVGMSGYTQMLNVKDGSNNQLVTTLDKYGPSATIHSGELAKLWGIPIIVSEHLRENLNATGVYDGTTATKTIVLLVYKPGFIIGNRRALTIKTAEEITTDQTLLVATMRMAFAQIYSQATDLTCGLGYNITS